MEENAMKVWINGTVVNPDQAQIPVLDHGLLYGDGVFEGIRCYGGLIADLDRHLKRLENSAKAIFLQVPEADELQRIIVETLRALGQPDAYIRLVITRGVGALGIDPASCPKTTIFCIAGKLTLFAPRAEGLRLASVSTRRPPADTLDPRVKSLNYLNNIMAKLEAKQKGADEALVLNRQGTVAEASGANVFCVKEGVLMTPPVADGALGGITRRRALLMAQTLGIKTNEQSLTRYDLLEADEVFITGTGAGIVSAGTLDGITLGANRKVSDALRKETLNYVKEHGTPVSPQALAQNAVAVA